MLAVLVEPNRVGLLRLLLDGERCVTQCTEVTGLGQHLVFKHLGRLVDVGLVERRRSGRRSYHSVVDAERVRKLLITSRNWVSPSPVTSAVTSSLTTTGPSTHR